ncbi:MAG: hypothetical protein M0R49_13935 [Limnochordia bacterium]|nr:hypothetical protein [Limnochordia bacterium]
MEDLNHHPWNELGGTSLGGYGIYLPRFKIKFQDGVENHLIFSWNLDGLVEVYDNGSPNRSEHLVTFRLDNPWSDSLFGVPINMVFQYDP